MDFDYDSAVSRVSGELEKLAEELWPEVMASNEWYKERESTIPDKARIIQTTGYCIKDEFKRKKFNMFYEMKDKCYWHATNSWKEIRKTLTDEDESLYAALMLEQAKNDTRSGTVGPVWIVQSYDKGNLKEFISDDLLKESVNKGFWKLANEYFTNRGYTLPYDAYDTLMKYSEHLDLKQVNEFMSRPILARLDCGGWIDDKYLSAFERARKDLDTDSGAWLARPIIEQAITRALSSRNENKHREEFLEKQLENYKEYLDTALIQKLMKDEVEWRIKDIDDENAFWYIRDTEILKKYLALPDAAIQEFISSRLPLDKQDSILAIARKDFPKEWLTSWKLSEIKEKIIEYIDSPPDINEKKEIISRLDFLNHALIAEYLDAEPGKERIENKLKDYLTKSRVSSKAVEALLKSLKPEYVSEGLYRKVVHSGISQMLNSARTVKSAYEWYEKAKSENWLDESEIPKQKLEKLKDYRESMEKMKQKKEAMKVLYTFRRKKGHWRLRKRLPRFPKSKKSEDYVQIALSEFE